MDAALEGRLRELLDKQAIAEVVQKWALSRDQGLWGELASTFHPGGRISVMWFTGPHDDFIAACERRFKRGTGVTKHFFGVSSITVNGDRALAESPAHLSQEGVVEGAPFVSSSWLRFVDRFERRAGVWRIVQRNAVYEGDRMTTERPVEFDTALLGTFRPSYRWLAYRQTKAGQQVNPATPTDASAELEALMAEARGWLAGE